MKVIATRNTGFRWTAGLVLIAVLVGLAGCSGGGLDDPQTTEFDTVTNESAAGADALTDQEQSGKAVSRAHVSAIEAAGSATVDLSVRSETGDGAITYNETTRMDLAAGERTTDRRIRGNHGALSVALLRVSTYQAPSTRYSRTASDVVNSSSAVYDVSVLDEESGVDVEKRVYARAIHSAGNLSWTRNGTVRYDGASLARYEADNRGEVNGFEVNATASLSVPESNLSVSKLSITNMTVQEASATLLIDDDGVVRFLRYRVRANQDGSSVRYTATLSVADVGSTTVEEPAWTANAEKAR